MQLSSAIGEQLRFSFGSKALKALHDGRAKLIIKGSESVSGLIDVCAFRGRISLSLRNSEIYISIGDCGRLGLAADIYGPGKIVIKDATTANSLHIVVAGSEVVIGRDCMISHDVHLQSCDQHGIVDLSTGLITNEKRNIDLGNHVWLGRRALVLPGVEIGSGSVIAAGAVVTRPVPSNSIAAGNPARIIRDRVTWSRELSTIDRETRAYLAANG